MLILLRQNHAVVTAVQIAQPTLAKTEESPLGYIKAVKAGLKQDRLAIFPAGRGLARSG